MCLKLLVLDGNTWKHIIVYKLTVLRIVTWNDKGYYLQGTRNNIKRGQIIRIIEENLRGLSHP